MSNRKISFLKSRKGDPRSPTGLFGLKIFVFVVLFSTFYFLLPGSVLADTLGQTTLFNVDPQYEYLSRKQVGATLKKISENAYWYVSDDYWAGISEPERNLFLARLDELAKEFDARIYPMETAFWGSEQKPGIDNDLRITVLITKLIDQAGGYFDTTHQYRKNQIPESNERDMVFISTSGIANERAEIFLAHEFQHLIGFYQKDVLRGAGEEIWLNEARAEYAPRLLGYDDVFETSNIRRRLFAFVQNPSDPLGEWKNEASDYGVIALFVNYLADHYGDKILVDSLRSGKSGIESLNEALRANGFSDIFSDIFANWTIASILNDETVYPVKSSLKEFDGVNSKFAYKFLPLKNLKIPSSQSYSLSGIGDLVSILNTVKDWQPVSYEFNTPVGSGASLNLKIEFSADPGTKFRIPYIAFHVNGQKDVGFLPVSGTSGTMFVKNFGSEIYKIVIIPADHSKISDFTKNDPVSSFTFQARVVSEISEVLAAPLTAPEPQLSIEQLIQDLFSQIQALQNQIAQLKQESGGSLGISRNLFVGVTGEDVRWLQDFLIKEGVYPEARITGYFGALTKNAVIRFQRKYRILPQIGYVGVITRAKIQELSN